MGSGSSRLWSSSRYRGDRSATRVLMARADLPLSFFVVMCAVFGCDDASQGTGAHPTPDSTGSPTTTVVVASTTIATGPSASRATASSAVPSALPLRPLSMETQELLLGLLPEHADEHLPFLRKNIGVGSGSRMHQGNPDIATHDITRAECMDALSDVTLQTDEQRKTCGGHVNMVPIYPDGDVTKTRSCIDVFEFPNQPCELPFVWASATQADAVCKKLGKRLCTQQEWVLACAGDPAGGELRRYAYGDELSLTVCNTNKSSSTHNADGPCDPSSVKSAYRTCSTNTEPSGAFAECRSRFGVFDLHGNVAEAMTRRDSNGKTYSQLKGSAFFYVDVHIKDGGKRVKERYFDNCSHDPRWHVEPMRRAWHVNYHLGFRCCYSVR